MFENSKQIKRGLWLGALALMFASSGAQAKSTNPVDWEQVPLPACPTVQGGGDGHSPDPLTVFNQHVELADGELYLLRGRVVLASEKVARGGRKLQPYLELDTDAHPWLAGARRKASPYYMIEGTTAYWRAFSGSYGEIAARAHVQFKTGADGETVQVISLKVIPELSLIPRRE
jgi:hypothetical protein